jgi:hypothetical protein
MQRFSKRKLNSPPKNKVLTINSGESHPIEFERDDGSVYTVKGNLITALKYSFQQYKKNLCTGFENPTKVVTDSETGESKVVPDNSSPPVPKPGSELLRDRLVMSSIRKLLPNTVVRVWEYANLNCTTTVSGNIAESISITRPNTTIGVTDWSAWAAVFDSYRVIGMSFRFMTRYPYDTSVTTPYTPLILYLDVDHDTGSPPTTSWSNGLAYLEKHMLQLFEHNRYIELRVPRYTAITGSSSATVSEGGWFDIVNEPANNTGSINLINYTSFTGTASTTYGFITVGWCVEFGNKR